MTTQGHQWSYEPTVTGDEGIQWVNAVAIGFLPWIFAYAGTRVLYGIETILEG